MIVRRIGLVTAMFLMSAIFLAILGCNGVQTPPLRVSVNSWVGFGPLYVAQEQGFFKDHGIDVEIITIEDSADRRAALISGRVDVLGSTLDDLAVGLSQGIDGVAFACADYSNGGDGIIASAKLSKLSDLASTPVAVQAGFVNHFFLLYVLDKNGIRTDKVEIINMRPDDAGAAFLAGSVDAAVTWEPHLSQGLEHRPGSHILARSDEYPEAILDLFVARNEWVKEHADSVVAFRAAWDQALEYMETNPKAADIVIASNTGVAPDEAAAMLSGAALLTSKECAHLLEPKIESLAPVVERIWREAGYVKQDIDLASAIQLQ